MNQDVLLPFIYTSTALTFISFIIGCYYLKTIKNISFILFVLVSFAVLFDIIGFYSKSIAINNLIIFRFYTLIEFGLIASFYIKFYKQYFTIKYYYIIYILITLICFIDYLLNGYKVMDSFSATSESFIFMFAALASFYFIMRNLITENIIQLPFFWFNSGILIYFSGNILLFIFSNTLQQEVYFILWAIIHSLMNIVYNTFISIGFIKTKLA